MLALIGDDGDTVRAQGPDLGGKAVTSSAEKPVSAAGEFQQAECLLKQFKAAEEWIRAIQQADERVLRDLDALTVTQMTDMQRDERPGFGDPADGDIHPRRLLIGAQMGDGIRRGTGRQADRQDGSGAG